MGAVFWSLRDRAAGEDLLGLGVDGVWGWGYKRGPAVAGRCGWRAWGDC